MKNLFLTFASHKFQQTIFMKNSIFNKLSLIIIFSLLVSSCEKAPLTNGKPSTETREFTEPISSLYIYDDISVTLIKDDSFRIEVTTGENLMEKITSNVINGALYLRNENIRNWARSYDYPLEIKVYHNSINHINYKSWGFLKTEGFLSKDTIANFNLYVEQGSGDIDLSLNCKNLNINSNDGTSKITVRGSSEYTYIRNRNTSPINALELTSKDARAEIHHIGSIYINCENTLDANIYNFGNIYYKGNPKLNVYEHPLYNGRVLPY